MNIVFGASGFIGSNLINFLQKKYKYEKNIGVSRSSKNIKKKNFFIRIDLKKNIKKLNLYNFQKVDRVFMCAGDARVLFDKKKEEKKQVENNDLIFNNIIKFCIKKKVKKIIFISSSAVYSKINKYPLSEQQSLKPESTIGKIKKKNELSLKKISKKFNIKILILRVFTLYGLNMRKDQFIFQVIKKIKNNNKKIYFWNKDTYRNFMYIDDLVKIIDLISKKINSDYKIINVGTKKSIKISKIITLILKLLKIKKKIIYKKNKNNFNHFVNIKKQNLLIKNFKFTKITNALKKTLCTI